MAGRNLLPLVVPRKKPETSPPQRTTTLAKINYSFEKRQRELAKKKQKEEKLAKKRADPGTSPADATDRATPTS